MNCPNPTTCNRVSNIYQKKLISQNSIDHSTRSIKSEMSLDGITSNLRENEKFTYDKVSNLIKQDKIKEMNKNKKTYNNDIKILDEKTNLFEAFKVEHHFPIGCGINENTFKNNVEEINNDKEFNENTKNKLEKQIINVKEEDPLISKYSELKEEWEKISNRNWKYNGNGKL